MVKLRIAHSAYSSRWPCIAAAANSSEISLQKSTAETAAHLMATNINYSHTLSNLLRSYEAEIAKLKMQLQALKAPQQPQ